MLAPQRSTMTNPAPTAPGARSARSYEPPRTPIADTAVKKPWAPTVGYLIGALVQLGYGTFMLARGISGGRLTGSIAGLLLVFLGVRAIIKYRAHTHASERSP
jgi:hypothetical protein